MAVCGIITRTRLICLGLIAVLLAAGYPLQAVIERTRADYSLAPSNPLESVPAGEFAGTVLIGGFRAIAVDFIWLQALKAEENRDWHRLLLLNQLIANLQPRFTKVWSFSMWNMGYNLSLTAPTDREAWVWIKRSFEFGKEGFDRNRDSVELAWDIGDQYYHKCGQLSDEHTRKFQQWLLEETGRTNWEHAAEWFEKAYNIAWSEYEKTREDRDRAKRTYDAAVKACEAAEQAFSTAKQAMESEHRRTSGSRIVYRAARRNRDIARAAVDAARQALDHAQQQYEKISAEYQTGNRGGNPNRLSMVATAYRQMAYEAEEKAEYDKMYEYRRESISWLKEMQKKYPLSATFQRYALKEIADIEGRIDAHQRRHKANEYREAADFEAEIQELIPAAMFWMETYRGNPYIDEQRRHLEEIRDRMVELAKTGPEEVKPAAERLRTEISLRLLSAPEFHAEYIQMADALDVEHATKLDQSIESQNIDGILTHLSDLLRLRLEKHRKEPTVEKRADDVHELIRVIGQLEEEAFSESCSEELDNLARQAWFALLKSGYGNNIESGITRLKDWVDRTIDKIGKSDAPDAQEQRRQVVDVLNMFNNYDYHVDWTVSHLRQFGKYYVDALERSGKAGDIRTAIDVVRRADGIWRRILQRYPDDEEAKLHLNRTDKLFTIYIAREPLQ